MLITILSWIYIFIITLSIGFFVNRSLSKFIPVPDEKSFGVTGYVVTGLTALTVYAEVFSIFYKVGAICHLIMLAAAIASMALYRADIAKILTGLWGRIKRDRNLLMLCLLIILLAAFFTSRGTFHKDTGIYHAQAIRIIEEYGVLKGLGNFQLHFAYNSSYLPLCALFTLSFLLPHALHTMTGFFMVIFTIYAVDGLFDCKKHTKHGADMARIAILVYALTNITGLQSPATDYGTMFMTLYIMCAWISFAEERETLSGDTKAIAYYGYLSVLSAFTVSLKLSAALLVILPVVPLIMLIKRKMWKETGLFVLIGFLALIPFIVRNVIISGWLFYPIEFIDVFDVVWKIPAEYMKHDSDQIKVWGRCLYDVTRVDEGVFSWLPIWWENKQHYEEMLIYSQLLGGVLLVINGVRAALKRKFDLAVVIFYVTVIANLAMWFFTAPFIRYGLAFMLLLPLCAVGDAMDLITKKKNLVITGITLLIAINFCSWIDNYFMDDLVFVKHNLMAGYYIDPIPFEDSDMAAIDMNGQTVYVTADYSEINSYNVCPGCCYGDMAERTELIGSTIREGFKAK